MLDIDTLRSLLSFDPDTGDLTWLAPHARAGMKAGHKAGDGYSKVGLKVGVSRKIYQAHRLAWAITYGEWPPAQVDHINRDRSDNRIVNLRLATVTQNHFNSSPRKGASSPFKGVRWHKRWRVWMAAITVAGKPTHLGSFRSEVEAAKAYDREASRHFGSFAYLNFPSDGAPSHA